MSDDEKPLLRWKVALVLLPVLLGTAIFGALLWKIRDQGRTRPDARLALAASPVSPAELRQHYRKLSDLVGGRDWESVEGRKSVRRVIAFIDGTLSPQNYGFEVQRGGEVPFVEELWPTLWVDLEGKAEPKNVVLVAVPYDRGNLAVGALLAIANDLRDDDLANTVRLVFYPARLLADEPRVDFLAGRDETVVQVLAVNRLFGPGRTLWLADENGEQAAPAGGAGQTPAPDSRPRDHGSLLAEELRIFGSLGAPVLVCRGSAGAGPEPPGPFPGGKDPKATDGPGFDRYVERTILLRDLLREMARMTKKGP
ncbi:MAG: hypothetical protein HKO57_07030 [Akkermansiaceae bacterium]|nr:hypothetical protein [Akkermansiaceae bacterium]